jgi:hypothetical protein
LTVISLACAIPGLNGSVTSQQTNAPAVAISRPVEGQFLEVDQPTTVESVSIDADGVTRVELVINDQVVWVDANADPEPDTPFIVAQPWTPKSPGEYIVQVRAFNAANATGQSKPITIQVVTELAAIATEPPAIEPTTPVATLSDALPTKTAAPTEPPSATPTPNLTPSATPTITPTPTVTPKPQNFEPTDFEPEGRFAEIWLALGSGNSRLGYPTGPEIANRDYAKQFFENGLMFWWDSPDDPDPIWVLDSPGVGFERGDTSNRYIDTWEGDDPYSCAEARSGGPVRGFGKVWCDFPELQNRLGFPSEPEGGSGGQAPYASVQFFQGGVMIYNPINSDVYVLFEQGDWQRFEY